MNFQDFCNGVDEIDGQKIEVNDAVLINFFNKTGKKFSTDPMEIVSFLNYVLSNHERCVSYIEGSAEFDRDKTYLNYKENPYRDLYKSLREEPGLGGIAALGGSQTVGLTNLISKFVCFFSGKEYVGSKKNTYLDKDSISAALVNLPSNINDIASQSSKDENSMDLKRKFQRWLSNQGLSDKSIKSYSGTCISEADRLAKENGLLSNGFYNVKSKREAVDAEAELASLSEWENKNSSGNGMYQAGLRKYLEFLVDYEFLTRLPKPFILLAGISGTGKSRFVKRQAEEHPLGGENFCLVPVRPDWHEPSDLLGYVSRIGGAKYVATKALKFIVSAWKAVAPNANKSGVGNLELSCPPYWLCLDEMNLAPVEQYFSDYLSVLESRKFEGESYSCEALLDESILQSVPGIQEELGLKDDQDLWEFFSQYGISLPPNLIVAGTVNMDETTHGFSRKVIDRALSIDFGEFYPNEYDKFFGGQPKPKILTYSTETQAKKETFRCKVDTDGKKTINFLTEVNKILNNTPFELAYRALNELLLYVNAFSPEDDEELQAVWDDFMMTKVLPRIDGDEDKLRPVNGGNANNLLEQLESLLADEFSGIWSIEKGRVDLLRNNVDDSTIKGIGCRSRKKIDWMKQRLEKSTFTSYWP